ncbi:methyltransferase, FxLD system [Kribbella sandramycini]|uniref:Protein-L-isoaspartate O-methyltransferase n=1 Tax=Kribbella sandramycini TaxID=60450 RepID=A0A7Y4KZ67_9ACTN|nr:methyltransferase, FxLD system [Kribbella sandramycini]MBB6569624.1 protein-L-isoaspartate(D-aspartate) O-methyltransferase [Kribbella sandramycini]NOL40541.1 methyltransferase, FxLD system [Kribbella sandramycini]
MTTITNTPETLRAAMVDQIKAAGHATTPAVEQALRTVPRHAFVPEATLEDAYADIAVITKRATDGSALSCASVPTIVAMMLDQLQVQPGHRILEIGAGTGYNAALLTHLTGPTGKVTTVDIDPEVTDGARRALDATGNQQVHVITRDGALAAPENAPYDRIIFTVGAWDLPPALWEQLALNGRLVVPLRWRGQTRSVAFNRSDDALVSDSMQLCGFVPMIGQEGERTGTIDPNGLVSLYWDADQTIDPSQLTGVLDQPKETVWSDVLVGPQEPFDGIWLRLTAQDNRVCRLATDHAAIDTDLCTPAIPSRSPALVEDASLAYLAIRKIAAGRHELGAVGHGPHGKDLARRLCDEIEVWNQDREAQPLVRASCARPAGENGQDLNVQLIEKTESRLLARMP